MKRFLLGYVTLAIGACGPSTIDRVDASIDGSARDGGGAIAARITGITPPRGPHTGGFRAVVEGAGFPGSATVEVDGIPVPASGIRVASAGRISVVMPAHAPGAVDIAVVTEAGRVVLDDAFTYDALAVDPSLAPRTGGARVTIRGAGTNFTEGDSFVFGSVGCTELTILAPTEASCRVPASAEVGAVDVEQHRGDQVLASAPDGFRYVEEPLTFGGITGGPIQGVLSVTATGWVGPIANAVVLVVDDANRVTRRAVTNNLGVARFEDPTLVGSVTVHVGHECYSRTSLVGVDANELVVPLAAHRTGGNCPAPSAGIGVGAAPGAVEGRMIFLEGDEFLGPTRRWIGVPEPLPNERRVAFVTAGGFETGPGEDPPARMMLTEENWDPAVLGFPFRVAAPSRTVRVCAAAGLQTIASADEPAPPVRVFVIGCSQSVLVPPYGTATDARIEMTIPTTGSLDVQLQPLPSLAVETTTSPTEVTTVASGVEADVGVLSWFPGGWDDSWSHRSESAPTMFRPRRLPVEAAWWDDEVLGVAVSWGDYWRRSGSFARLRVRTLAEPIVATPLGIPSLQAPLPRQRIAPGNDIRFELDGQTDLVRLEVRPADYAPGGAIPTWHLFARGDRRALALLRDDAPEFALPDATYAFIVVGEERPGFDFDSWSFFDVELETAWTRRSINVVYARIDP